MTRSAAEIRVILENTVAPFEDQRLLQYCKSSIEEMLKKRFELDRALEREVEILKRLFPAPNNGTFQSTGVSSSFMRTGVVSRRLYKSKPYYIPPVNTTASHRMGF